MLRNKQLVTLSIVAIVSLLMACKKDFLDRNPLNSVSSQIFWTSEEDVNTALTGVYSRLQQNFLGYERVYLDGLSDNAFLDPGENNQPNMQNMTIGGISPGLTGAMVNMYTTPYRAIASCNYFLDNVDKAPINEQQLNNYQGEVRFIRALAYFDLAQTFGGVVIYTHFPETLDEAKIAKSSREEVYALIEEDLQFAIAHLPDEKYSGHAVRGSAQALMGRVLITQQKWAEAIPYLEDLINGGIYSLADNYAALFTTAGQANANINREIIFSTQYLAPANTHRVRPGAAGMDIELGWFSLMQPYKDLVDDYEMTDGNRADESPLFDPENPYANRDPRLDLTVKLPGEIWRNSSGEAWTGSYESYTGFLTEKYVDLSRAPFSSNTATASDQDYIHLRFADVLLMYAEARNEISGPDASVYDALDRVREREGIDMPSVNRTRYQNQENLRDYIRHERRVELALEGQRYNDLKRWNIAHLKLPTLRTPADRSLVFEPHHYLLPFSLAELDNNPYLVQNEGY
ncbi:RagB/SusD family nutrient uptake outer membrane protein [Olivibacter sp. SDN3]|uniref:RagB/SusD family nutrient uptake outer membrane protein n=1 Tax=Olivibacter sp. SDN3 TaxID=2764720 RepID=UPI0016517FD6|nr:RagB/SusD family nutrient uptake outer membrane protein [Olivibacter sp. SDN3]QNL52270.1 RagB/SusD family nutrient uptake outer membrane protein [Olivibacter sp. SDN3]